jgi:hypothetical protein
MTQLAFHIFYKPDDDLIGSKHVAVLQKQKLLLCDKIFVLDYIIYYIIRILKYL